MLTDREVERWYLGLPFDEEEQDAITVEFPSMNEDEVERIYLGLPLMAA